MPLTEKTNSTVCWPSPDTGCYVLSSSADSTCVEASYNITMGVRTRIESADQAILFQDYWSSLPSKSTEQVCWSRLRHEAHSTSLLINLHRSGLLIKSTDQVYRSSLLFKSTDQVRRDQAYRDQVYRDQAHRGQAHRDQVYWIKSTVPSLLKSSTYICTSR